MSGVQNKLETYVTRYYAPVATKIYDICIDTPWDLDIYTNIYARERVEAAVTKCSAHVQILKNLETNQ